MRFPAIISAGIGWLLLFASFPASAQTATPVGGRVPTAPVSGAPPHIADSAPQVVPTPPTVTQPSVADDLLASAIASPTTPAAWVRQTVPVAPCILPPKIDGRLDDACWRTATRASGFFRLAGNSSILPADQTEVWICADTTHLYVAFHCRDSQPQRIHASATQRDGNIYRDDYVGVDVDSQNSRHNFSSFFVTARGTQAEQLEGGTADNISWAGDWKAATQRTRDGWTCEMSIPFALLHYLRGATAFGMDFYRSLSRENTYQNWPYLPPQGAGAAEGAYIHEFIGLHPSFFPPRPIFLPYTLATAGTGNSVREGMDIKYPLSTTLTGVATLFPDFQTIEQDVTSINFSYTEKLLTDRRPFFAEGAGFLPGNDLFYSRRIGAVDGGLKVAGKQGDTTLGLLATDARGTNAQNATVFALSRDIGLFEPRGRQFRFGHPDRPAFQSGGETGRGLWLARRAEPVEPAG